MTSNGDWNQQLSNWLAWDKNETTLAEIRSISDPKILEKRLCSRLKFGTAGLRGVMQAGFSAMNDLVVIQSAQGLCQYVLKCFPNKSDRAQGVAVGFDGRYNSKRFAQLTTAVFLNANIPVWLYSEMVATPFIPFAIVQKKCLAGVMVTASHNPKEDNGYKVYWQNGAQIKTPHDKNIERSIEEHLKPLPSSWDLKILSTSPLLRDPHAELCQTYTTNLLATIPPTLLKSNAQADLEFVYTAMHGVGYEYIRQNFAATNLRPVLAVIEQRDANPDFPTVRFPNPEEGASSLELSMRLAKQTGAKIILANDPDADRLACAELNQSGDWKVFTGNELGALLGWWSLHCFRQQHPDVPASDCYMLCSTVSSRVLRSMAAVEGFQFEDTLTGFKWMGNRTHELAAAGKHVLFAYEEAIGFMVSTMVLDKDGVSAAVHLATLCSYLKNFEQRTLADKLEELYQMYGYHYTVNSYFICHEAAVIASIFRRIRNFGGVEDEYPKSILDGKYTIKSVRDLTTGFDSAQADRKATLPSSSSSEMITFSFDNGVMVTLRTSGTEPKIKYYTEMCAQPGDSNWKELRATLGRIVDGVVEELLQPQLNKLIARD